MKVFARLIPFLILFVLVFLAFQSVQARCVGDACASADTTPTTAKLIFYGKATNSRPGLPQFPTKTPLPTRTPPPTHTPAPTVPVCVICRPGVP